jgi:hypothetical protein
MDAIFQLLRYGRRILTGPASPTDDVFSLLDLRFNRSQSIVQFYYLTSALFGYLEAVNLHSLAAESEAWDLLWPVWWLSLIGEKGEMMEWLAICLVLVSLLAIQYTTSRIIRILVSVLCLLVVACENSLGGIDHNSYVWLWVGVGLIFLPNFDDSKAPSRSEKLTYLSTIVGVQALVLSFYTLAGFWKAKAGLSALVHGAEGNFSPRGLALQLADRILQSGTQPLLGRMAVENYWIIWPMFVGLIYVQLTAITVIFRRHLHVLWGNILALFHIWTWLFMEIYFPPQMFFVGLLFIMSPFRPRRWKFREAVVELPFLGFFFGLWWRETPITGKVPETL